MKQFLGDGVYVDNDGFQLELTTSNGMEDTNRIYLEPEVWGALVAYVVEHMEQKKPPESR